MSRAAKPPLTCRDPGSSVVAPSARGGKQTVAANKNLGIKNSRPRHRLLEHFVNLPPFAHVAPDFDVACDRTPGLRRGGHGAGEYMPVGPNRPTVFSEATFVLEETCICHS